MGNALERLRELGIEEIKKEDQVHLMWQWPNTIQIYEKKLRHPGPNNKRYSQQLIKK